MVFECFIFHKALLHVSSLSGLTPILGGWQDVVIISAWVIPGWERGCGLLKATRNEWQNKTKMLCFRSPVSSTVEHCFFSCNNLKGISYFSPWSMQHISVIIYVIRCLHRLTLIKILCSWRNGDCHRHCGLNGGLMLLRILL